MERYYAFAGIRFRVCVPEAWMYPTERDLENFRTEPGPWDHCLEFAVVDALDAPEGEPAFAEPDKCVFRLADGQLRYDGPVQAGPAGAHTRILRRRDRSLVQVRRDVIGSFVPPKVVLRSMEAEHQIARCGGLLLHAAFIRHDGRAILFTAPSGVGKSTQAELWQRFRGAELINGDRAAVMPGTDGFRAWGVPYPGCSGVCRNGDLPLAAIVCLSQAPESRAKPIVGLRAFRRVWEGCSVNVWNPEDVRSSTDAVLELVQRVRIIDLACTMDETAVTALERLL